MTVCPGVARTVPLTRTAGPGPGNPGPCTGPGPGRHLPWTLIPGSGNLGPWTGPGSRRMTRILPAPFFWVAMAPVLPDGSLYAPVLVLRFPGRVPLGPVGQSRVSF